MERSEIRGISRRGETVPDYASLHPGYEAGTTVEDDQGAL